MRILARVLLFLAGVLPGWAFALGLGEINLTSYLNQPLNAEIKVHSATDEELNNLLVTLAPVAEFSRMGIDYMPGIEHLKFSVEKKSDGSTVIKVVTRKNFREPFLNILVEVNWPKGRILREYTLLVDPPVLILSEPVVTQPAVVAAPSTKKTPVVESAPQSVEKPAAKTPSTTRPPIPQQKSTKAEPSHSMDMDGPGKTTTNYGPTKRNDTLWKIAKKVRPDQSISMNQAMLGLLRENPKAFVHNNINRLKAGYVLRVPDQASMTSLSKRQANTEVSKQYHEWRNLGRKSTVANADATPGKAASKETTTQKKEKPGKGRLELLAPKTGEESEAGAGTKIDPKSSKEEVIRQLAFTRESEEAKGQENAELRSQVTELESQIENNKRLFDLQDDELADLRAKLAELQKETPAAAEDKKVAVKPEAKPKKAAEPAPPKEEPGLVGQWLEDPLTSSLMGIAILIVVILLAVIVKRRSSSGAGFKESILQERMPVDEPEEPQVHIDEVLDSKEEERQESGEEKPPTSSYLSDFAVSSIGSMHDEVGEADPLTEADVFLAYGRFQPAEAMIHEAIENQPDRNDLKFKLLEIYYAARNEPSFEKEAAIFKAVVADDSMWDKVVEMGQDLCPDSALFGGSGSAVVVEPDTAEPASDEVMSGLGEVDTEMNPALEEEPVSDTPIDFDLGDFEAEVGGDVGVASVSEVSTDDDLDLDFDLGMAGDESAPPVDDMGSTEVAEDLADELEAMASSLDSTSTFNEDADGTSTDTPEIGADFEFDTVDSSFEGEGADSGGAPISSDEDEMGTKLDLARAYIDMGDPEGAKSILNEVIEEGDDNQKSEAQELMQQI